MGRQQGKAGKGSARKIGRNIGKCARYRAFSVRKKNKERKVLKHLKKHPNDKVARKSINLKE